MKHLKIRIYGKVQGVYYRATAVEKAKGYGICGFVRNEQDGSVYIEAEGEEEKLKLFLNWCNKGSARAIVERVGVLEGELKQYTCFITIREL